MEIDIKENKEIVLEILPNNAKTENLELCSSNSQIAILEKSDVEDTKDEITLKIKLNQLLMLVLKQNHQV